MGGFGKNKDRYIENQADKKLKQLFIWGGKKKETFTVYYLVYHGTIFTFTL